MRHGSSLTGSASPIVKYRRVFPLVGSCLTAAVSGDPEVLSVLLLVAQGPLIITTSHNYTEPLSVGASAIWR